MAEEKISPLFKYIGGKTWLRNHLRSEIEKIFSQLHSQKNLHYVEPFAGGLGAFLNIYDLLLQYGVKKIILNDINSEIISFYQLVNTSPQKLIQAYMKLEHQFKKTVPDLTGLHLVKDKLKVKALLEHSHDFYNQIRAEYNTLRKHKNNKLIDIASRLLFLQNHGFNGIYRENSQGDFNTPFNWAGKIYSKKVITDKIMNVYFVFQQFNIKFSNLSYSELNYRLNGLYYLDPPYLNEDSINENKYHKDAFGVKEQEHLIKKIRYNNFLYSNHESSILTQFFYQHVGKDIEIQHIPRKNIISASIESRKTDKIEMLVTYLK